jgi:hypothetical protein
LAEAEHRKRIAAQDQEFLEQNVPSLARQLTKGSR